MRNAIKQLATFVGIIMALAGGVAVTASRFLRPELTETQLFLALWPTELFICAGAVLCVLGMRMK